MYYETNPYGVTTQYYIPVSENIANPRITYSYPGNTYEVGSNKRFAPFDVVDIAHYQDNTGNNQMTYTGDIGDIATALDKVEKQGKRNLTHLFTSPPTKSQPVKQESQPAIEKGYASSLNNPAIEKGYASSFNNPSLQQTLKPSIEKGYASFLNNPVIQKQMKNIVEKEKLKKSIDSALDNPVFKARFDNSKEMEKKYSLQYEQSKYTPSTLSYTPSTFSYTPAVRPREQQSWQERIKKDEEMEKRVKEKELERLKNEARERLKKEHKKYYGYGIAPPIYPSKMLVNLVKLLTRIYEGYASKKVVNETKRLLKTLYNNKIITETVYNHLANI